MRRRFLLGVVLSVAAVVLTLTHAAQGGRRSFPCPAVAWEHSVNAPIEEVVQAAHRLVPRFYAHLESQGHAAWPHFKVDGLLSPDWHLSGAAQRPTHFAESLC